MGYLVLIEYFMIMMMMMVTKMMMMMMMMMMMVTKKMMMRIITITLRKCGSFGFPAAPAVALLSLLAPENSSFKYFIACHGLYLIVIACHCLSWLLPQIVC